MLLPTHTLVADGVMTTLGLVLAVPLTATVLSVAPLLAQVTLPLGVPVAVAAMRT